MQPDKSHNQAICAEDNYCMQQILNKKHGQRCHYQNEQKCHNPVVSCSKRCARTHIRTHAHIQTHAHAHAHAHAYPSFKLVSAAGLIPWIRLALATM